MSKKRYISDSIWTDPWFETQSPHKKLLFMYLLTNKLVSISWFYEITLRQISFDTGISQSDVNKYISDFENDKKVFYHDGMLCIVNFVKNQNIKSEEDNMWKGIQREILELWEEKLISMLNYKGLIRVLQGAYKVVPIPYLTLLNSTLPNYTWPYEEFEAPFVEEIQETKNPEDTEKPKEEINQEEWTALLEWEETFTSMMAQALVDIWWKPDITVEAFVKWVKKKMNDNRIEECEQDFYRLKAKLSKFVDHYQIPAENRKIKDHRLTLWKNYCLEFNIK